jgi:Na+/melibiose symporter-like transporter
VAKEGAVNTPEAIRNLGLMFVIGPSAFALIGAGCFVGWRLGPQRHAEIRAELDRRDAEALASAGLAAEARTA